MWKKSLVSVGLAALLAVPVGAALATDGDHILTDRPLVTVEQDQERDQLRDRVQNPTGCDNCVRSEAATPARAGDRDRDRMRLQDSDLPAIQERDQTRLQEQDHTAIQEREQIRTQERDCDGKAVDARLQERARTQTQVQNQATHPSRGTWRG